MTPGIADFLLARIAEDEDVAKAADPGPWKGDTSVAGDSVVFDRDGEWVTNVSGREVFRNAVAFDQSVENTAHIARWDPARVLAKCAADRRIVELHNMVHVGCPGSRTSVSDDGEQADGYGGPCAVLRLLALPYADHSDYRDEWKP